MTRRPSTRAIDALAYPDALERAEAHLVGERRRAVDPAWRPADPDRLPEISPLPGDGEPAALHEATPGGGEMD